MKSPKIALAQRKYYSCFKFDFTSVGWVSNVWINSIRLFLWVLFLFILEVLQVYWGQIKLLLNPGQPRYDKENPNDDDNDGNDSDYDCDNYGDWRIGDANNNMRMMTMMVMITMMMTMMTMMIVFQPKLDYFQPCSGQHAFQPLLIQSMRETWWWWWR